MDLVDRFLDIFLPVAEILKSEDLTPMFPPLEPGGDYWDTTFLQSALEGMLKRGKQELLSSMALTAYAWTYGQDIFWGKGGPEKWSGARPYMTPANCQDQFGFFIFDWYQAIARKSLGHTLPIFLLAAGCRNSDCAKESDSQKPTPHQFEETNATLYQLVTKSHSDHQLFSKELKACNFWLLSAAENQPESEDAWFSEQNQPNPVVNLITKHQTKKSNHLFPKGWADSETEVVSKSIGHYILLPKYSWDAKDWLYEVAESVSGVILAEFGYSIADTLLARRVTIVGSTRWVEESIFNKLSSTGCVIEEYYGDGTLIASKLLNL